MGNGKGKQKVQFMRTLLWALCHPRLAWEGVMEARGWYYLAQQVQPSGMWRNETLDGEFDG